MKYKDIRSMSDVEYAKYKRSLERRVAFWGTIQALHPWPLVLLILLVWGVCSYLGYCQQ